MKKGIFIGGIIVVILLGSLFLKNGENPVVFEGMVLEVGESEVLISQRQDLKIEDLTKDKSEWLSGDYGLVTIKNISDAKPGMLIRVQARKVSADCYPQEALSAAYEVVEHRYVLDEEAQVTSLLELFPTKVGFSQRFSGYGEYGHTQTLRSVSESAGTTWLEFQGNMRDGYGQDDSRSFLLAYEVSNQFVIEHIQNDDHYNALKDQQLLSSIIPNKVILKAPLVVGNQWTEDFTFQGKSYQATTEIVRKGMDEEGKLVYETQTTVPNIDDENQATYQEMRTFSVGSGMTSFSNVFSLTPHTVSGEGANQAEDLYLFGYSLSSEN